MSKRWRQSSQVCDWLQLAETVSAFAYFFRTANKYANEPETTLKQFQSCVLFLVSVLFLVFISVSFQLWVPLWCEQVARHVACTLINVDVRKYIDDSHSSVGRSVSVDEMITSSRRSHQALLVHSARRLSRDSTSSVVVTVLSRLIRLNTYKKLSYRTGTARRSILVSSCNVPRDMAITKLQRFQAAKVTSKVIQEHWHWCHKSFFLYSAYKLNRVTISVSWTVNEIIKTKTGFSFSLL